MKGIQEVIKSGVGGQGEQTFPKIRTGFHHFPLALTYFPKKQHQKHIYKSPWYVNILMQSVAQAKFPIASRWMRYSILCSFGVSSTKSLLCWKRIWSRPTKRDSGSLKVFRLEIFRRAHKSLSQWCLSPAPTWIRIWKQKACWVCASVVWVSGLPGLTGLGRGDFRGGRGTVWGKREGCFSPFFPPFSLLSPRFPPETPDTQASASIVERRREGDNICYYFSLPSPKSDAKRLETDG